MSVIATVKTLIREPMGILIVDDRPENLLTLESIVEKEDRRIIKASGGNEALRIAIREKIDLILLDIQMPEIDGIQVARLLRSNNSTKHIPIIFVSAINKNERPRLEDFTEGTVDFLHKPLDVDETRNKVALHHAMYDLRMENNRLSEEAASNAKNFEQFVYIVSHDLKAPLRAIDNLTNWIADDLEGSVESNITENLVLMKSRVNRMRSLLEGVLEFSRCGRNSEAAQVTDLNHLAHAIFESIIPPDGFKLNTINLPVVAVNPTRIYNIFYHLIKNAIIHHHNTANGVITLSCESNQGVYKFTIADNGPGIKPQYADKIFELFATLKSKDELETTGVGLTIVRKVLQDLGGQIALDSSFTNGTSFNFTIPIDNME